MTYFRGTNPVNNIKITTLLQLDKKYKLSRLNGLKFMSPHIMVIISRSITNKILIQTTYWFQRIRKEEKDILVFRRDKNFSNVEVVADFADAVPQFV